MGTVLFTVPFFVTFILPLHSRDLVSDELAGLSSGSLDEVLILLCCV